MLSDELRYRLLKRLEADPHLSQRELARELGISLGKANYCLKALIAQGWIKVDNFKNSRHKMAYRYLLTPAGIREKAQVAVRFLKHKQAEYATLEREIAELRREMQHDNASAAQPKTKRRDI